VTIVGYARVSSVGQSLEVQRDKLLAAGVEPEYLYEEKASGTLLARTRLQACFDYVRKDDILLVTRLDRSARSTLHLCQIAQTLERKEVALRVLDQNIDTSDATGRLLFNMLGAINQFETEIRAERQMDGIRKAQARGVRFGGRPTLAPDEVTALRAQRAAGVLIKDLQRHYRLSKASVYRYLAGVQPQAVQETAVTPVACNGHYAATLS
jgi:DNA invertase Pin-like site-specific DNA recombinase